MESDMSSTSEENKKSADGIPVWTEDGFTHIDVRRLDPPKPLIAIIKLIESDDVGDGVIVIIDRDPLLLYQEVEQRGWGCERLSAPPGEVRLRLVKDEPT